MALATEMTASGRGVSGSALFTEGMSSMSDPMFISDRSYRNGVNIVNRGGILRTRPGYNTIFTLPTGQLQGLWYFRPLYSEAYLVFAVAGLVYTSQYPFTAYSQLQGVSFYPYATQLFAESAVKSAQTLSDGTVQSVDPVRVFLMQDGGFTKAAYWDGSIAAHLDPSDQATAESTLSTTPDGGSANGVATYPVASADVTYGGTGYAVAPLIQWPAPDDPNGAMPTATAVMSGGSVIGINLTSPGSGYVAAPVPFFVDGNATTYNPPLNKEQIPLGGPMVWSGDRLWVAQNNKLFSSDISNPLSFIENIYAAAGGFFEFTEPITAVAEVPAPTYPFVAVFTDTSTSGIQSSIRDRSSWKLTPAFQSVLFPGVGCTSHRSVVKPLGELWWMSPYGLISFASALQADATSKLVPQDTKMLISKSNLSPDLSLVAAGYYENFIMLSVPYADKYNQHTWVYDQAASSDDNSASSNPAWAGIWTGTRPVQWATGVFAGTQRSFFVSLDYDGVNRLWEAFTSERTDNGNPIQCFVETKLHNDFGNPKVTGLDKKKFVHGETTFAEVSGTVDLVVSWAGTRGKYKEIGTYTLQADEGSLFAAVPFTAVSSYLPQARSYRTREVVLDANAACSSLDIESKLGDWVDTGFSLLIQWTGQAALRNYRIFTDPYDEKSTGSANATETSPRVLVGTNC